MSALKPELVFLHLADTGSQHPALRSSQHVVLFDPQSAVNSCNLVNSCNRSVILEGEVWDVLDLFIPVSGSWKIQTNPTC